MVAIGIDLGSSKCCVGVVRNGRVEIIENERGNKTTPSYVAFTDTERLIGDEAKDQLTLNPNNTIYSVKRFMGKCDDANPPLFYPEYFSNRKDKVSFKVQYRRKTIELFPEQVSAMLLTKMKDLAEKHLGCNVVDAVISIPAHFSNTQRQATVDAAKTAGLNVLSLINEPTAAAIAYCFDRSKRIRHEETMVVVDFGGSKLNTSLLKTDSQNVNVIACFGYNFGGIDIDCSLIEYIYSLIDKKYDIGRKDDIKVSSKIKLACEQLKLKLSLLNSANCLIENMLLDEDFQTMVSREQFESLVYSRIKDTLSKSLEDLERYGIRDVEHVLITGGSSRIPMFQTVLEKFFGLEKIKKFVNADEAVAYGAAIQAALLSGDNYIADIYIKDISSCGIDLYINEQRETMIELFSPVNNILKQKQQHVKNFFERYRLVESVTNDIVTEFKLSSILKEIFVFCVTLTWKMDIYGIFRMYVCINNNVDRMIDLTNNYNQSFLIADAIDREAQFQQDSNQEKERLEILSDLECYCFSLQNKYEDKRNEIPKLCEKVLRWIDTSENKSIEELTSKKQLLQTSVSKQQNNKDFQNKLYECSKYTTPPLPIPLKRPLNEASGKITHRLRAVNRSELPQSNSGRLTVPHNSVAAQQIIEDYTPSRSRHSSKSKYPRARSTSATRYSASKEQIEQMNMDSKNFSSKALTKVESPCDSTDYRTCSDSNHANTTNVVGKNRDDSGSVCTIFSKRVSERRSRLEQSCSSNLSWRSEIVNPHAVSRGPPSISAISDDFSQLEISHHKKSNNSGSQTENRVERQNRTSPKKYDAAKAVSSSVDMNQSRRLWTEGGQGYNQGSYK